MTATDELRRLLDGRGIEYYPKRADETVWTASNNVAHVWTCNDLIDGYLEIHVRPITPEQAVEATLGKRECICRDESGGDPCLFICSYCDAEFNHPEDEPINYCPNCGRKVVDA